MNSIETIEEAEVTATSESLVKGEFYNRLTLKRNDSEFLMSKMEETVKRLLENNTDMNKPGMLLGKIQSGKTRTFIGIIALAFDNGYDMAIILTKGTRALAQQTYERLKRDFSEPAEEDKVQIYDIMHVPGNLPRYVLQQKLIMVVKKETNNLRRIVRALVETYPDLSRKKLLIIDDEADYASVGFKKEGEVSVQLKRIAQQVDELRSKVQKSDFLQVTATPYSLYLQPEELEIKEGQIFKPIRPAFTVLLPEYDGYIGGDYYFKKSEDENSIASHVYQEIPNDELNILRKEDKRSFKKEQGLESPRIKTLRKGILNFIVGGCIRKIQRLHHGYKSKFRERGATTIR